MKRFCWFLLIAVLPLAAFGQGQGVYTIDHVDGLWNTDTLNINTPITFYIRTNNNSGVNVTGHSNGFRIYSNSDAQWAQTVPALTGTITPSMFEQVFVNEFSLDGMGADTIGFAGFRLFATGIPDGFNEITYTITVGPIDASYHQGDICIDSTFYPPISQWTWSTPEGDKFPDWGGPFCYTIFDPTAPTTSNLIVSTDSIHFSALEGGSNPVSQNFTVSSDGGPLNFDLFENSGWLILSPDQGTTPKSINALIDISGLAAGNYSETILVVSGDADNSPQEVKVTVNIEAPPPVIEVSETEFYFNAVAGGSNPASKTFTILNSGGQTLNWIISNSEPWLNLSPVSGTEAEVITLTVDITGLAFDNYFDMIVITDPSASNSPVSIPVYLGIGSDLPIIEVHDQFNYVNIPTPTSSIPPWTFSISNGGAGSMSYWVEEDSPRILTLTPTSGTVPDEVEVGFKVVAGSDGDDFMDTVWVYSNEAINSPQPVVFHMHFTNTPAEINILQDTLSITVYECTMGAGIEPPTSNFLIQNSGGDDPLFFDLEYESIYFDLNQAGGEAPLYVIATANLLGLPVGLYFDTIVVNASTSINKTDTMIVKYNVIAGDQPPELVISNPSYVIPVQENSVPGLAFGITINNKYGGCLAWELNESVSWFNPSVISGEVQGISAFNVDATGMVFGIYPDSFTVTSEDAVNSPQKVAMLLKVWRFHGDWDYNAEINVTDLVKLVEYIFNKGAEPEPERIVGDMNCDFTINISDLTIFVSYLFNKGPLPCGNPY